MKFKEVAHLYIGCTLWKSWDEKQTVLTVSNYTTLFSQKVGEVEPILRQLSDMTEDDVYGFIKSHNFYAENEIRNWQWRNGYVHFDVRYKSSKRWHTKMINDEGKTPSQFAYLLKQNFDLFNLIESGEAIDATTLENNPYK